MTGSSVRAEQVRTLFGQSVIVLLANAVNALIIGAVLLPSAPVAPLVAWMALMTATTAARLELRRRYLRRRPGPEEATRWGARFVVGSTLTGVLWGVGSVLLFEQGGAPGKLLITFVVGGMTAGAAGTLAAYMPAFIGYTVPALAPLGVRISAMADPLGLAMGGMLWIYLLALVLVARANNRSLTEAFRLRFENEDLLAQLSRAKSDLEEINRTLEERVAERGAELEKKSEALRNAQRMESVGMLAGGVAHDFNNVLTIVLANVHFLLTCGRLDEEASEAVREIRGSSERAAALVAQLLAFSRRQVMRPKTVDLNRVVANMETLLARLLGDPVKLTVTLEAGPLLVKADPVQLEQVIINLASNARDAMPNGGQLTIETEAVDHTTGASAALPPTSRAGPYAALVMRDTGVGMDAKTRRLAFDPFFTTKETGQGTGLGLSTVYGIIEQSGGHVLLESEPGRGTTFKIYLPRAFGAAPEASAALPAVGVARPGAATVLLAEDEPKVRAVTERALRQAGYTVLVAEDGARALDVARAHDGAIELLVADIVMANLGGLELARRLAPERPEMRVLFMSGYGWNVNLPTRDFKGGVDFLQKPFTPDALAEKVARLLAMPGAPDPAVPAERSS
jgi:signal transduction histidine kinase/ActR/RegA family two-component response regulator